MYAATTKDKGNAADGRFSAALSGSPQRIPQYIKVPPNIEAKRIISYFSDVLSYSSKPLLLMNN